jgi:hypothetical protein
VAFTQATITHTFFAADGSQASGAVTFELTKRITNGTSTYAPGEVTSNLTSGALSQALTSNVDSGTVPQDSQWLVTIRLAGLGADGPYPITVPTGGVTVDLGTLLPQATIGG